MDEDELARIREAFAKQPDVQHVLELLLSEARGLTHAEAGRVYLREGNRLRCAAVQNDVLTHRLGSDEAERRMTADSLNLVEPSIADYVALTPSTINVVDAYEIPSDQPYRLDRHVDATTGYRTRSVLAMPIRDRRGSVFGVLELINALNEVGGVIPFGKGQEATVAILLTTAARIVST